MSRVVRVLAVVAGCLFSTTARADEPKLLFEEKFTGKLDRDWVWLHEDAKAWRVEDGTLSIVATGGSMWRSLNNYKNILMRPAPVDLKDGFQFEVLLDNAPQQQFEHAGIACRYDDDNYVILNKEFLGQQELLMIAEVNALPLLPGIKQVYEPREVWLRMTVSKGRVVGHYRAVETDAWLTMGEMALPKSEKPLQIGLIAGLGKDGREARFRKFRVTELEKEAK